MSVDCIYAIVEGLKSGKVITATELSMTIGYSTSAIESGIRPLSRSKLVMGLKGKGGGRTDIAMAGGKDIANLASVMEKVPEIIASI